MENDTRLHFGSQYKFPLKLMEVANDGILIRWTRDEKGLLVEETPYEENVMSLYPGFVQVGAFHNLRRLFRDYEFKYRVQRRASENGSVVEFRNPFFIKNDFESLLHVLKRPRCRNRSTAKKHRKNKKLEGLTKPRVYHPCSLLVNTPTKRLKSPVKTSTPKRTGFGNGSVIYRPCVNADTCTTRPTPTVRTKRQYSLLTHKTYIETETAREDSINIHESSNCSYGLFSGSNVVSEDIKLRCKRRSLFKIIDHFQKFANESPKRTFIDKDRLAILQHYAKNELNEAEFWEVMTRRYDKTCKDMSWEMIKNHLDDILIQELSPLHFKGFYYELSLSEM